MASNTSSSSFVPVSLKVSREITDPRHAQETLHLFNAVMGGDAADHSNSPEFFLDFVRSSVTVDHIRRGHISSTIVPKPPLCNTYGTLHGGSVGSLVNVLSHACARTIVGEDKELFLGETSISYLSATPIHEELVANASVVKSERNLSVVALDFKLKKTGNPVYICHSTFYHMPASL
ncbi:uncharacterized protein LOC130962104 [Arachis stenosperma]|uniref:uncharacterized protein LOC130962104 n=1 Tax=Arachis stenosperma TaxID=217475 RepID=UPI0025AD2B0D|nr:uncharacterized protein LOC130962104 [Arachis stenosperma]